MRTSKRDTTTNTWPKIENRINQNIHNVAADSPWPLRDISDRAHFNAPPPQHKLDIFLLVPIFLIPFVFLPFFILVTTVPHQKNFTLRNIPGARLNGNVWSIHPSIYPFIFFRRGGGIKLYLSATVTSGMRWKLVYRGPIAFSAVYPSQLWLLYWYLSISLCVCV